MLFDSQKQVKDKTWPVYNFIHIHSTTAERKKISALFVHLSWQREFLFSTLYNNEGVSTLDTCHGSISRDCVVNQLIFY